MAIDTGSADPSVPERKDSLVTILQDKYHHKRRASHLRDWSAGSSTRTYALQRLGLERLLGLIETWEKWDENIELKGRSSAVVTSSWFTTLTTIVIVVNTAFVAYATDWSMENLGSPRPASILVAECCFLFWYSIEVLLHIEAYRWHFFSTSVITWHLLDLFLVCVSVVDVTLSLSSRFGDGSSDGNVAYLRIVRIVKLAKIARTWRVVKAVKELSVILESFKSSILALFWCFVFLAFLLFIFSLIFMQGTINYLEAPGTRIDEVVKSDMIDAFGTVPSTMLSLYKAVTGGAEWTVYYYLLKPTGSIYAALYLFYTFFFGFAVVNILTGIFVEKAMAAAQPDIEQRVLDKRKEIEQQCEELKGMIVALDIDSSGTICRGEFKKLCRDLNFLGYMAMLGVDLSEAEFFFDLLASVHGRGHNPDGDYDAQCVHVDALVEGCLNMKGGASSIDMQRQIAETQELRRQLDSMTEIASSIRDGMHENFAAIRGMRTAGVPEHVTGVVDEAVYNKPDAESKGFSGTAPRGRPPLPIGEWRETSFDATEIEATLQNGRAESPEALVLEQNVNGLREYVTALQDKLIGNIGNMKEEILADMQQILSSFLQRVCNDERLLEVNHPAKLTQTPTMVNTMRILNSLGDNENAVVPDWSQASGVESMFSDVKASLELDQILSMQAKTLRVLKENSALLRMCLHKMAPATLSSPDENKHGVDV